MGIINIGLIGPGNIARRIVRGIELSSNAKLYAVGSRDIKRAEEFAKKYNAIAYYNDELLDDEKVDAVYIAIPNPYHYLWIKKALLKGKHVICEKPLVMTVSECEELFKIARSKNLLLMEAMKSDFLPITKTVKEKLDGGDYGKLLYIDAKYSSITSGKAGSWVFDPNTGGGLRDVGVYPISYCNLLVGSKIKLTNTVSKENDMGLDLLSQSTILYENNVLATCTSGIELKTINDIYVYTDKGYFLIKDYWKASKGKFVCTEFVEDIECEMIDDFKYEIEHFCECIINGLKESPIASCKATMEILKVIEGRKA